MRDFTKKLNIIWLILKDDYTSNTRKGIWWLRDGKTTIIHRPFKELPKELK